MNRRKKEVYVWIVDEMDLMKWMFYLGVDVVVISNLVKFQGFMEDFRIECFEEGFLLWI